MRIRLENDTQFWEAHTDGAQLTRRYGKLRRKGRTYTKAYPSALSARYTLRKLAAEKRSDGYRETERLEDEPCTERRNPKLDEALDRAPFDHTASVIYADWLHQLNEPRAELIQLHEALLNARSQEAKALKARQQRLLKKHAELFLGPLHEVESYLELTWRLGFIQDARLIADRSGRIQDIATRDFKGLNQSELLADLTEDLLTLRSARTLKSLRLMSLGGRDFRGVFARLMNNPPPHLSALSIAHTKHLEAALVRLDRVDDQQGARKGLRTAQYVDAGVILPETPLRLPKLQTLSIEAPIANHEGGGLPMIARSELDALTTLRLSCAARTCSLDMLDPLLQGRAFPNLEHLHLPGAKFGVELCRALIGSPLGQQLRTLDITGGRFDDFGAALVAQAKLPKLQAMLAHRTQLTIQGRRALQASGLRVDPKVDVDAKINDETVVQLCEDERVETEARALADVQRWRQIGRDKHRMWGQCHAGRTYRIVVSLPRLHASCDCQSRKSPCKHALALMFLASDEMIEEGKKPAWLY